MVLMKLPKNLWKSLSVFLFFSFLVFLFFCFLVPKAKAEWIPDSEVTMVGKSAERARQLLFWFFSKPSLDNSSAIRSMWAISRNISLAFLVIIVVGFGFQLIIAKEKAKFESFLPKLAGMIVFAVFSYVIVLGLIQVSDLIMKFFVEKVMGQNLFNITFIGGNVEANYTNFVGYKENNPANIESAKTSLFLIKTTTFTYNTIFVILVLRKIFLWFLLIVSPFLPLLFSIPLSKNVGWIWIGVFFQWLFYGPLFSIFLAGLVKIWEVGIPFGFDFSRAGQQSGQIYPTAINILYGGPKQVLSSLNSANYVDTYAEYMIGLIMLWAVTLLPWFLLRNFRDYCCETLKSLEAATVTLYGKLSGAPPSLPSVPGRATLELPFKKVISSVIPSVSTVSETSQVSKMKTSEILRSVGLGVSTLADVSRLEMDLEKRKSAHQKLEGLKSPVSVPTVSLRRQFSVLNQELMARAAKGDVVAERTLTAASKPSLPVVMKLMQKPTVGKPAEEKGKIPLPVGGGGPSFTPRAVSVEDYEEVKKMWINNYKEGDVPISEEVKSREDWLKSEVVRISDTMEMLSSIEEEKKQKGLENLAAILPFLLMGGFTEQQASIYLKAKFEAARVVLNELEEAKKSEQKEEVVKVPLPQQKEKKEMELKGSLEIEEEKKP